MLIAILFAWITGLSLIIFCFIGKYFSKRYIKGDCSKHKDPEKGGEEEEGLLDQPFYDIPIEKEKPARKLENDDIIIHFEEDTQHHATLEDEAVDKEDTQQLYADLEHEEIDKEGTQQLYSPPEEKENEEEEDEKREEKYELIEIKKKEEAIEELIEIEPKGKFMDNAKLHISLQYLEGTKCISGVIRTIEGLNLDDKEAPHDLSLHTKIIPKNKFRMKTKWRTAQSLASDVALRFTLGPIKPNDLKGNKLAIKLYGKKENVFAAPKLYGRCYISLNDIAEKEEATEFLEPFIGRGITQGGESLYSTSGSETE